MAARRASKLGMRHVSPVFVTGLSLLAAGCAAPQTVAPQAAAPAQGVSYSAQVVSVREVSPGLALPQVMQILGQPNADPPAGSEEIVVQLPDGSVKTLVPPPGAAPASLKPGARVVITETPQMHITAR